MGNKSSARAVTPTEKALQQALSRPTTLRAHLFDLGSIGHHGVPSNAKTLAFCSLQGILAVGTASGAVKLYGNDGLEILINAPRSNSNLTIGVMHMKFTAQQRLVVTYSNSSIRIYNLAHPFTPEVEIPETWTLSTITCIETIRYQNFPFIFVALDDGNIHVIHEDTGKTSTYVITPRDVGIMATEDEKHLAVVTALVVNPRDANQLLIAYEISPLIYQWDLSKHKLAKDYSLTKSKGTPLSPTTKQDEPNSVQCLSWHSSGKRFVAGFKYGGIGVFRHEKPHGLYHQLQPSASTQHQPVVRIQWICAPPTSRHSHLSGAILFAGGPDEGEAKNLTLLTPPRHMTDEDATTSLVKSEQLTWGMSQLRPPNEAAVSSFVVATDQVDFSTRLAPFSAILLSGNPLDGHQPGITVQSLPCFVRLKEDDKEEWEWIPERLPSGTSLPPPFLQRSQIKSFTVINLSGRDGSLQDDLIGAMNRSTIDPIYQLMTLEDFEWPINGGSVVEPIAQGGLPPGAPDSGLQHVFRTSTMLITGHANGNVLFWETVPPSERASRGTIKLLHVVSVSSQLSPKPTNTEISSVAFCKEARTLMVGFVGGEIAMLEFGRRSAIAKTIITPEEGPATIDAQTEAVSSTDGEDTRKEMKAAAVSTDPSGDDVDDAAGYHVAFSLHIHSSAIKSICFSTAYQYAAIADDAGVVSLIELKSYNYELLIFDVSSDEPVSIESLLFSELVQVTEIPVPPVAGSGNSPSNAKPGSRSPPAHRSQSSPPQDVPAVIQHKEIVPILFVGRGNGKLEMFHVQTAKKIGESLFDPHKLGPLSSIIMVDTNGRKVDIRGKEWSSRTASSTTPKEVSVDNVVVAVQPAGGKYSVSSEVAQFTEYVLATAIAKATDNEIKSGDIDHVDVTTDASVPSEPSKWVQREVIETRVPAGSLGLHLYTEVNEHAIVKGFVLENEKALALAAEGVSPGHAIVSINGVDLLPYARGVVCSVLEQLRDHEKVMVFAQGFEPLPDNNADPEVGSLQDALAEKPRFLVCTCGKSIHLVQAALPKASEIASVSKDELPVHPLASLQVSSHILETSIIRIPVQDRVENCLVVIDQSQRLYVVSLMTLSMVWSIDLPYLGNLLDGICCKVSANGELIVANSFGEIERFTIFSEATQRENAVFERCSIKTRVLLDERKFQIDQDHHPSPRKKGGIAALKKLVSGAKDVCDLNKVFHFSVEDEERRKLIGGPRKSVAASSTKADADGDGHKAAVKKTTEGLGATKDALHQAAQHLQERGEKLSDLAVKTEQMKDSAEDFYKTMKAFNDKNTNKKWYEF